MRPKKPEAMEEGDLFRARLDHHQPEARAGASWRQDRLGLDRFGFIAKRPRWIAGRRRSFTHKELVEPARGNAEIFAASISPFA